jgi:hypothetical protein
MEAIVLSSRSDLALKAAALALVMACGACSDNLARRDTIAFSAGNAMAANRAIMIIDPYPRRSFIRGQQTDGLKAQQGARKYLAPDSAGPVIVSPVPAAQGGAPTAGATQ